MDLKGLNREASDSTATLTALCLTVSAALFFFGTGLEPVWLLMWFAPIPVLWLAPRITARQTFLVAAAAYAIGALNEWSYMALVTPLWVTVLFALGPACMLGAAVQLFRFFVTRGRLWQAALAFPSLWVTYEYLLSLVSIHGTIGNLGYSQIKFLPVLQVVSLTGIWGISFSLLFFSATVAALFSFGEVAQKRLLGASAAVFFVCLFGFGFGRLANTMTDSPKLKVALLASDDTSMLFAATPQDSARVFDSFGKKMKDMAGQGIQMFVLPEHSGKITDDSVAAADAQLGGLAKATGAFVAVGVDRSHPDLSRNEERLYGPDGTLVASYDKHHLLPPWESQFTPGKTRVSVKEPSGIWGLGICKDMDFPKLSRGYGQDGVGLMVVPGWDFFLDGWSHGSIAIMRGVESGFSVARSAKRSVLYATDDRGRVLGSQITLFQPIATLVTTVPVHHDVTLYTRWGDWFAWVCIALLAGVVTTASLGGKKIVREEKSEVNVGA